MRRKIKWNVKICLFYGDCSIFYGFKMKKLPTNDSAQKINKLFYETHGCIAAYTIMVAEAIFI